VATDIGSVLFKLRLPTDDLAAYTQELAQSVGLRVVTVDPSERVPVAGSSRSCSGEWAVVTTLME
jgi:hypothetical protein